MKRPWLVFLLCVGIGLAGVGTCGAAEGAGSKAAPPAASGAPDAATAEPAPPPPKYDEAGAPMPPVTMKSVDGTKTVVLDKVGKPAMYMFVNSSCSACRAELSAFSRLSDKNKDKMVTYVVTVDFDPQNTVTRYPDLANMPYTILDGSDFEVARKLGFNFTPATVIADASGKQVFRKGGFSKGDDALIFNEIQKIIK